MDAVGVGAVRRRDHPEEAGLHAGAPREGQVELLPVLQRHALHAHAPARLEVHRLRAKKKGEPNDQARPVIIPSPPAWNRYAAGLGL